MSRTARLTLLVLAMTALALCSCVASVGVTVPIGSPWGYGPYGGVTIGTGPIYY